MTIHSPHAHTPTRPHAHTPTRPHAHTPTRPHAHTPTRSRTRTRLQAANRRPPSTDTVTAPTLVNYPSGLQGTKTEAGKSINIGPPEGLVGTLPSPEGTRGRAEQTSQLGGENTEKTGIGAQTASQGNTVTREIKLRVTGGVAPVSGHTETPDSTAVDGARRCQDRTSNPKGLGGGSHTDRPHEVANRDTRETVASRLGGPVTKRTQHDSRGPRAGRPDQTVSSVRLLCGGKKQKKEETSITDLTDHGELREQGRTGLSGNVSLCGFAL